jgi:hypothetical protein
MKWFILLILASLIAGGASLSTWLLWRKYHHLTQSLGIPYSREYAKINQIPTLEGYVRDTPQVGSFSAYLQNLPLKQDNNVVYTYEGKPRWYQDSHFAVVKLDVGKKNLQQCADVIIRLRAEYLFAQNRNQEISFHFTNGDTASYQKYLQGYRPIPDGNVVQWVKKEPSTSSVPVLHQYLEMVYTYAGTASLAQELKKVKRFEEMEIGDVLVKPGVPLGHAVLIVDSARHPQTGEKIFLIAQGNTPAEEMHVIKNFDQPELTPWWKIPADRTFRIQGTEFRDEDIRRFN